MPGPPSWDGGQKPGNATIAFGQAVPPVAPPTGNQTLAFGAAGAGAPPAANQTMVFGAPATAAPPAPAGKQTVVFGAPALAQPPPVAAGKQTMVFGAPAPAPASAPDAASNETLLFGAPVTSAPAVAPATKQMMVFGAPAADPATVPPQPSSNHAMAFGASAAPPAGKQTMVFGAVPAPATAPASAAPQAPRNQTMMFGRAPGALPRVTSDVTGQESRHRSESTVRVDLEAMMRGQGPDGLEAMQARHDRTQRFAMAGPAPTTPAAGSESVEARHNRTQLFVMSSQQETTKPDGNALPGQLGKPGETTLPPGFAEMSTLDPDANPPPAVSAGPAINQTLVFGAQGPRAHVSTAPGLDPPGVRVLLEPGMTTPPEASAGRHEPIAPTLRELAPVEGGQVLPPLRVELPPEPTFPASAALPPPASSAAGDEELAELRARSNRRTAIAVVIFLVIALGLGLALLWHLFGRSILGAEAATTAVRARLDAAIARLRMDDAASRAQSIAELEALLTEKPDLVEARAGLVMALAFAYDDAGAQLALLEARAHTDSSLQKRLDEARKKKTAATGALKPELSKLEAAYATLPSDAPARLEVLRALAVAYAVLGDARAIELAVQHKQNRKGNDDWADLAIPEYQAVAGASIPEALELLSEIRGRESNSTFFRVLVLTARLHLKAGDPALAEEDLKTVTALNARHELAAHLLEHVAQLKASAASASAARQPGLDGE